MPVRRFAALPDSNPDLMLEPTPVIVRTTRKAECRGKSKLNCTRSQDCTYITSTKMRDHCRSRPIRVPKVQVDPITADEINDIANINKPFIISIGAPLKMNINSPV